MLLLHGVPLRLLLTLLLFHCFLSSPLPSLAEQQPLPGLSILSPHTKTLLWGNLVIQLELNLSNFTAAESTTAVKNIEICIAVTAQSKKAMNPCFPINLAGHAGVGGLQRTELTLEIEDANVFLVKAYIKGCATDHCQSTIEITTCRQSDYGVLQGGALCKAKWNRENQPQQ